MGSKNSKTTEKSEKVSEQKQDTKMSKVVMIDDEEQFNTMVASDKLVLVDYADWCPPCRAFAPILDQLSIEFDGVVSFGKVKYFFNVFMSAHP